ncbi:MAG: hypothetical protein OZSIB_2332 [Candidatus Ozemobacter sibiricus]|uniref:Uncharacterized protein n=1 Tax=Candidatus Ozemobacter sibiricus TaxID=2268124 RepID=A0A367ZS38_9BACT|nr:MAG: hypothetical protein OZSIB_2332 [Candidatus Ozemobacter sibiricus]
MVAVLHGFFQYTECRKRISTVIFLPRWLAARCGLAMSMACQGHRP